jgi:GT2 family glycosyltransferase
LISIAESEDDIGLVNPKFSQEDSSGQGLSFTEIDFCRGYCMLIKRKVVEKTGGLDEEYGVGYYDDDDYSVRAINAGFRCVRANDVVVEHLKDSTFKDIFTEKNRMELHEKNKKLFYSKWGRRLRLIFVITKDERRSDIVETLLSAARRQHIIYLWNGGETFGINHINIRERAISKLLLSFELLSNRFKKPGKRYDAIFVDDKDAMNRLCAWGIKIYGARDGVVEKIDELSGRKTI